MEVLDAIDVPDHDKAGFYIYQEPLERLPLVLSNWNKGSDYGLRNNFFTDITIYGTSVHIEFNKAPRSKSGDYNLTYEQVTQIGSEDIFQKSTLIELSLNLGEIYFAQGTSKDYLNQPCLPTRINGVMRYTFHNLFYSYDFDEKTMSNTSVGLDNMKSGPVKGFVRVINLGTVSTLNAIKKDIRERNR